MDIGKLNIICYKLGPLSKKYTLGLQLIDSCDYECDAIVDIVKMDDVDDEFSDACDWMISELKDAICRLELLKKSKNPASAKVKEKINDKTFNQNLPSNVLAQRR